MSYLLKGGVVATFKNNQPAVFKADVLVEGSTIVKVTDSIEPASPAVKVIDCSGKWIAPGMVDIHRCAWFLVTTV